MKIIKILSLLILFNLIALTVNSQVSGVSPSTLVFGASGGSKTFSLYAQSNWYWGISSCSWTHCSPEYGNGNRTITVTCDANNSYSSRTCNIDVGGKPLTITQSGQTPPSPPSTPSTPSVTNYNGYSVLTRGTPPSGVTWYWQGTNSNGTSTSNSSSTYLVNSSGTYYLRARSSSGLWSLSSSSRSVTVTTCTAPSNSNTSVCYGQNKRIEAATNASNVSSHKWYNSSGGQISSGIEVLHTGQPYVTGYTKSGSYTQNTTYYVSSVCGSIESSKATINVTVNSNQNPSVTISASKTTICSDVSENVCFTATAHDVSGLSVTYQWYLNNSAVGSNSSSYCSSSLSNNDKVKCRITTSGGSCVSSSTAYSNEITISAIACRPTTPSTPSVTNYNGYSVLTRGTPPSGVTWYWQGTNSNGTSTSNSSSTYQVNSSGTYYLRARNSDGLWSSSSASKSVTVTTCSAPSNANTQVCYGESKRIEAATNASNVSSHKWYNSSGGQISSGIEVLHTGQPYVTGYTKSGSYTQNTIYYVSSVCNSIESSKATINVTVNPVHNPSVSISASNITICSDVPEEVCFTATAHDISGLSVAYQWYLNNVAVGTNSSSYCSSTLSNYDKVKCKITVSGASCIANTTVYSNEITISATTCRPTTPSTPSVTNYNGYSVLTRGTPPSGVTWYWQGTNSNGTSTSNSSSTYQVNSSGTYYLRARSSDGLWSSSSASKSVTVTTCTAPSNANTHVCYGDSKRIEAATNASNVTAHKWYNSEGGIITSGIEILHTGQPYVTGYTKSGGYTQNTIYYVSSVCGSIESEKGQINVIVDPSVVPWVSISSDPPASSGGPQGAIVSICQGDQVTLTAQPFNGGSNPTYVWRRVGGGNVGTGVTCTLPTLYDGDQYVVDMTSNANCRTTSTTTSEAINMDVTPKLNPYVTISAPKTTIGVNESLTFTATAHDVSSATVSYQWFVNNVAKGTNSSEFTSNSLIDNDLVKCEITVSGVECINNTTDISNEIEITVIICDAPSNASTHVCYGQTKRIEAATNASNVTAHKWYNSDGGSITSGIEILHTGQPYVTGYTKSGGYIQNTIYYVSSVCGSGVNSVESEKGQINVIVDPSVTPHVSISSDPPVSGGGPQGAVVSICQGEQVTLTALPYNGGSNPTYVWKRVGGGNVGTGTTCTLPYIYDGDQYYVEMTTNVSCQTTNTAISEAINIDVKTVSISLSAQGNTDVFTGEIVSFSTNGEGLDAQTSYNWYSNNDNNLLASGTGLTSYSTNTLPVGTHNIYVKASNLGCNTPELNTITSNVTSIEVNPLGITYNQPELPFSTSNPVGSLQGVADVSPTGAATYTIPISLPPGTAGMMPSLSVIYNSQSAGGMLGHGWTIGGFSAITRIPANLHDDNNIDGVNFNDNDRFALDGNRLVSINGNYGADGTEYRTQMETFVKIYSYGNAGNGPQKFHIETKDGKILEYGYNADSRFAAAGRSDITMWLLNKITDKYGNYYTITYHMENKEYYPEKIEYTGNANAGLSPYNTVKFLYGSRNDQSISFIGDAEIKSTTVLQKIVTECEGNQVAKYEFKYNDDFTSKLNEIVYYEGSAHLNSTKIDWGDKTSEFDLKTTNINGSVDYCPGDYNGDGKTDMVILFKKKDSNGYLVFDDHGNQIYSEFRIYYSNGDGNTFTVGNPATINRHVKFLPGDFDSDGKTDILSFTLDYDSNPDDDVYHSGIYFSEGQSTMYKDLNLSWDIKSSFNIGDFNGDGRTDWCIFELSSDNTITDFRFEQFIGDRNTGFRGYLGIMNETLNSVKKFKVADFNGNGKTDIMLINNLYDNFSCQIFEYDNITTRIDRYFNSGFPSYDHRLFPGDFNGDGKTDLLSWVNNSSSWEIHYFGEDDFIWTTFPDCPISRNHDPEAESGDNNYIISDFNGDGKADILEQYINWNNGVATTSHFNIYYSKGKEFESVSDDITAVFPYQFQYYVSNDFNGDGKNDCFMAEGYYADYRQVLLFNPGGQDHLVTSVTNGLNKETQFEYLSYTDNRVYSSGTGNSTDNKVIEVRPAIPVVYKLNQPNGIGNNFTTQTFWYRGLKYYKKRKSPLGFESVHSTDELGLQSDRFFEYDDVFYSTSLRYAAKGKLGQYHGTRYVNEIIGCNNMKSYIQRIASEENYNTFDGRTINTTYGYDAYNNNTSQVVDYNGEGITTVTNEFIAAGTWCPSVLKKTTIEKNRSGVTGSDIRISEFTYYPDGGLKSQIVDPGDSKQLTTEYINNTAGMPTDVSISDLIGNKRTTEYEYDSKYRFLIKESKPLYFNTEKTYDPENGNVLTETDILGHTTQYIYDDFDNLIHTDFPDGNTVNITTGWTNNNPENSVYYVVKVADGSAPLKTYYNHLGKEILKETNGFNGSKIYGKTEYTTMGQVYKQYEPSFLISGEDCSTYNYDDFGRITDIVNPVGTTAYNYNGSIVTMTDPSGKATTKETNAYGDVVRVNDNGGEIIYDYNNSGLPITITAPGGAITAINYDLQGNKLSISDPNAGITNYQYDAFGNLLSQTDAGANNFVMTYDKLNRIITKTGPDGTTTYVYDNMITNGKGQISSVAGPNNINQNYEYDTYGRMITLTETIDGQQFEYSYTYDNYGREKSVTYPSGFGIVNEYNNDGYLEAVKNSDETFTIWEGVNYNAFGQPTLSNLGNGQTVTKGYDNYHRINSISYSNYAVLGYEYYTTTGNLKSRTYSIGRNSLTENFTYDNLNRLKTAQFESNAPYLDMVYEDNGNITFKDDVGTYEYNSLKPHAVTDLVDLTSQNPIPFVTQDIDYNSFNKVERIEEDGNILEFTYGPDQLRKKTVLTDVVNSSLTKYFMGAYEEEISSSGTKKIHYISGADGLVAVFVTTGNINAGDYYFTYTDHLGSIIALADNLGTVSSDNEQNFDPWGRRRNLSTLSYAGANTISLIDRGFTGHQHLDVFGIINMNGRLYDPVLGRMLSPDNFVQTPDFTQNFNRYSYCFNNPLVYTDPDGEIAWFVPIIIGAAVFGTGNLTAHAINGDVNSFGDGLKYFGQGALAGAALTAAYMYAPAIPYIGNAIHIGMNIYGITQLGGAALSTVSGLGQGLFTSDWSALGNAGKIFLGNFYLDENRSLFGGAWQGFSRHTWELPQTGLGHTWTQLRNTFGAVDRVDYLGGATFATRENRDGRSGVSLGNFININISDEIVGDFESRVITDPLFMHEYGHTFDSQIFGISYLFAIGLPSIVSAGGATQVDGEPFGVTTHDFRWYEMRANRHASRYFGKHYGVDWLSPYRSGTIETYYPRRRR